MKPFDTKSRNYNVIIIVCFFLFQLFIHSVIPIQGDGAYFARALDNGTTLSSFLCERYQTWSSRLIIEAVLVFVSQHVWLWRVTDSLVMLILALTLNRLCFDKTTTSNLLLTMLAVLMYPFADMSTASFCATTVNYLWPLTAATIALLPLKNDNNNPVFLTIASLSALFAANQEQVSCLLFFIGFIFLINNLNFKKEWLYPFLLTLISFFSIVFQATCPGNHVRTTEAAQALYPLWPSLNIFDKVYLSLANTATVMANNAILVSSFAVLALLILFFRKSEKRFGKIISILVALFFIVVNIFRIYTIISHSNSTLFEFSSTEAHPLQFSASSVFLLLYSLVFIVSLFWLTWRVFSNENLIPLLILSAGFISKMALTFSPTINSSGRCATIFFYFSIIVVALMMIKHRGKLIPRRMAIIFITVCAVYALAKYSSMYYLVVNKIGTLGIA